MKIRQISGITAAVLLLVYIPILIFSTRQDLFSSRHTEPYSGGWTCSFGSVEEPAAFPAQWDVPENTEITLTNTLPEDVRDGSAVAFRSRMQEVRVYVGSRLAWRFPEERLLGGELTGAWHFVPLEEADAGKEIRICLSSPYAAFSGRAEAVMYGDYNDLVTAVISRHIKTFRISVLIGIIGALTAAMAVFGRKYHIYGWFGNLGLLLLDAAGWMAGEAQMPSGIVGLEMWHYLSLISLLFCPVFLTAYLYARWPDICGRATAALFWICLAAAAGGSAVKLAGGPDFMEQLPVMLGMTAAALAWTLWIYILAAARRTGESIRSELFCVLLILAAGLAEGIRFVKNGSVVGLYIRAAVLVYALYLLQNSVRILYRSFRENQELRQRLRRSRAELMASQIRPHFIYNTLNSIRALISLDPEAARQTVYDFSTYLRLNLENMGERELIRFPEELRHIRAYLNIEKVRFEERLSVTEDIRETAFSVPPLSIQPLVENAVKHGICRKMAGGTVTLRSRSEEDAYVVEVEDDGAGFDPSLPRGGTGGKENGKTDSHIGLENIRFRVEEISGGTLAIESRPGEGTRVTVRFPKGKGEGKQDAHDSRGR